MKIEKKKALIEKWARCVMTGDSEERNAPCEISQAIADDINAMLNPIPTILIPFYIAELETAATSLRAQYPDETDFADVLKQEICTTSIMIKVQQQ